MPLQWPTYFALNAKSCLFDLGDPQIGSLLTPVLFWSLEKRERVGLGEVDDGKWRGEIKTLFLGRESKVRIGGIKERFERREGELLGLEDPEKLEKEKTREKTERKERKVGI